MHAEPWHHNTNAVLPKSDRLATQIDEAEISTDNPHLPLTHMVFSYRAFFGGAREGGCLFCPGRRSELKTVVFEVQSRISIFALTNFSNPSHSQNEEILVIKNRGLAGIEHWLIILHKHIRDIENLKQADLPLRK